MGSVGLAQRSVGFGWVFTVSGSAWIGVSAASLVCFSASLMFVCSSGCAPPHVLALSSSGLIRQRLDRCHGCGGGRDARPRPSLQEQMPTDDDDGDEHNNCPMLRQMTTLAILLGLTTTNDTATDKTTIKTAPTIKNQTELKVILPLPYFT